jgi:hypothetical protein
MFIYLFYLSPFLAAQPLCARKVQEFTQAIFSRPKLAPTHETGSEADTQPADAGGKVVPMEKIHIEEQQPLLMRVETPPN